MKLFELTLFFIVVSSSSAVITNLVKPKAKAGEIIPGRYIVKLKNQKNPEAFKQFFKTSTQDFQESDVKPKFIKTFNIGSFNAHVVNLSEAAAKKLEKSPEVEYVEPDSVVTMYAEQLMPPNYGAVRVSQRELDLTKNYNYPDSAGEGIDVYVIDTGVDITNPDFEGRATWGANFSSEDKIDIDENGHGSHVAGTVAGKLYGIAKKANIIAVKVLDINGRGSKERTIAGINFVVQKAKKNKSVINMSLGGSFSQAQNDAVKAAYDAGIPVVVAAGNSGDDSCKYSPSSAPQALTVVASDRNDTIAEFSSFGNCTDIIAPGVDITSIWNNGKTLTISGTSMASPHVAGIAAIFLSQKEYYSAKDLYGDMIARSTLSLIKGMNPNEEKKGIELTPNRLAFNSLTDSSNPSSKRSRSGIKKTNN